MAKLEDSDVVQKVSKRVVDRLNSGSTRASLTAADIASLDTVQFSTPPLLSLKTSRRVSDRLSWNHEDPHLDVGPLGEKTRFNNHNNLSRQNRRQQQGSTKLPYTGRRSVDFNGPKKDTGSRYVGYTSHPLNLTPRPLDSHHYPIGKGTLGRYNNQSNRRHTYDEWRVRHSNAGESLGWEDNGYQQHYQLTANTAGKESRFQNNKRNESKYGIQQHCSNRQQLNWTIPKPIHATNQSFRDALLCTIHSLYHDELRPTLAEIRRRLQEYQTPTHLLKDLPAYCAGLSNDLKLDMETQEVFLLVPPEGFEGFVDPKSPIDPFHCCVWKDFDDYMTALVRDQPETTNDNSNQNGRSTDGLLHYQFQGGRYGMAVKMRKDYRLQSEKLSKMSVGNLCHLVQLSIAYGIVQYENNILQPRATCLRIAAAFAQSDLEPERAATNREAIRDETAVKESLKEILKDEPNGILLSQLKFAFENRLSSRLCQSVFGCTRLSNLLQLPAFQSTCRIIGDSQSRVFVQATKFPVPWGMRVLHQTDKSFTGQNQSVTAGRDRALSLSNIPLSHCCSVVYLNVSFFHWKHFNKITREKTIKDSDYQVACEVESLEAEPSNIGTILPSSWAYNEEGAMCFFRQQKGLYESTSTKLSYEYPESYPAIVCSVMQQLDM